MINKLSLAGMIVFVAIILQSFNTTISSKGTKVWLVPTLHGIHRQNPKYTYDSLRAIIAKLDPDVIAVEIRPEDMAEDSNYLKSNYPYEMWMMQYWFPSKQITGFDWLGKELEKIKIPANYWKERSGIKKLQQQLNTDSVYAKSSAACDSLSAQRLLLLSGLSITELLKSNDAMLTNRYYDCLQAALKGSRYEMLTKFYEERNERILHNLERLIASHPGKRIVILTGDDHRVYLQNKLKHLQRL